MVKQSKNSFQKRNEKIHINAYRKTAKRSEQKVFIEYKQTPTSESQERPQIAETLLQETFEGVDAEILEDMIQEV